MSLYSITNATAPTESPTEAYPHKRPWLVYYDLNICLDEIAAYSRRGAQGQYSVRIVLKSGQIITVTSSASRPVPEPGQDNVFKFGDNDNIVDLLALLGGHLLSAPA